MVGWDDALMAVGSTMLGQYFARQNAAAQNDATIQMMRDAPAAQMEGLRNAGLNPMLAYDKLQLPMGSAAVVSSGGETAQNVSALGQARASAASAALMTQQAKTEGFRAAVMHNDAIKGNYELMDLAGKIDAAMRVTGGVNGSEALSRLAEPQVRAGLAELRAALASATNDAQVYEALNSKAVNLALDVLGRVTGAGSSIAGAVDRYRARSQRGDIINLNKD